VVREDDFRAPVAFGEDATKPPRSIRVAHWQVLVVAGAGVHNHESPVADVFDVVVSGATALGGVDRLRRLRWWESTPERS
jgi:hypothetical protein